MPYECKIGCTGGCDGPTTCHSCALGSFRMSSWCVCPHFYFYEEPDEVVC